MQELTTTNGSVIPAVGMGTYPLHGEHMATMAIEALKLGYRLIDTADDYRGETGIGLAINRLKNQTDLSRDDIFIQTKISQDNACGDEPLEGVWFNPYSKYQKRHSVDEVVREKVAISLRELKTDYIDSLLIHYPFPGYFEEIWQTMINLRKEGFVRYIGVSNFHISHIEKLNKLGVSPDINQIYLSPLGTKNEDVQYADNGGIQIMTYSPLMDVTRHRIDNGILQPLMDKYGKSATQIILRWNIERGCIPLPRTKHQDRLRDNFNVFDFKLDDVDVERISALNMDNQVLVESKQCPGI